MTQKHALLVYPAFATSFWSFKFALQYLGKKSSMPPLGLLTLANMFPSDYHLRLVDMNVHPLTDADLQWADLVCTSTMIVQRQSLEHVITRAKRAGFGYARRRGRSKPRWSSSPPAPTSGHTGRPAPRACRRTGRC